MRWLMLVLLVSLGALLVAVGGLARHVWLQHRRPRPPQSGNAELPLPGTAQSADSPAVAGEVFDEELDVR